MSSWPPLTHQDVTDAITRSVPVLADMPPGSANALDDEFTGSSLDAKWSWVNQGTSTAAVSGGRLTLSLSSTSDGVQGITQTAPSGNWTVRAKCLAPLNATGDYQNAGILAVLANNTTIVCSGPGIRVGTAITGTTTSTSTTPKGPGVPYAFIEAAWDNTALTLTLGASVSGEDGTFDTVLAWAPGSAPAKIGLGGGTYQQPSAGGVKRRFEWFRRVA